MVLQNPDEVLGALQTLAAVEDKPQTSDELPAERNINLSKFYLKALIRSNIMIFGKNLQKLTHLLK